MKNFFFKRVLTNRLAIIIAVKAGKTAADEVYQQSLPGKLSNISVPLFQYCLLLSINTWGLSVADDAAVPWLRERH